MEKPAISSAPATLMEAGGDGERAVGSVVAVSLLLLITLALAVFSASVVVELSQVSEQEPTRASLSVSPNAQTSNISITHRAGDGLADGRIRIVVRNETSGREMTFDPGNSGGVLSVGDTITIDADGGVVDPGASGISERSADTQLTGLTPGMRYSVRFIDTRSDQIVFESVFTP